jgi:hypothetical protein
LFGNAERWKNLNRSSLAASPFSMFLKRKVIDAQGGEKLHDFSKILHEIYKKPQKSDL